MYLCSSRLWMTEDQNITVCLQHAHCVWREREGEGRRETEVHVPEDMATVFHIHVHVGLGKLCLEIIGNSSK